ncbi:MAG TPA: LON peptidase substrate-binding domain-containing protein, partial [Ginsengibacter sp.]|nr:LON peptidase substrate-binding domain-containing protein [Ginsengibacter sp.]
PIIPLNEGVEEGNGNEEVPDELPILPLRNTVLFPGVVIPITAGREKSIKAVNDAYKEHKLIGVVAQKDSNVEEPKADDLAKVGSVARIIKTIRMPDGGLTVIMQGKTRFEMGAIVSEDPYFRAKVKVLPDDEYQNDESFEAMVASIKDLADEIIRLSPNVPSEANIILKNIENPSFLIHFISSNFNSSITDKQKLLEIDDPRQRAELLLNLLQTE